MWPASSRSAFAVFVFIALVSAASAGEPAYVWLEAEKPSNKNFDFDVARGVNPVILSDANWIQKIVPADKFKSESPDGWHLEYGFDVQQPGQYELWARVGYEKLRAPVDWRIDDGRWSRSDSNVPTTNLNEAWGGWNEIAWLKLGSADLSAGKHKLVLRLAEPAPANDRMMMGLDCIALVKGGFHPEGKLQPGQLYNDKIDIEARENVFKLSPDSIKSPAERIELSLDGVWEAARWDDPDMDAGAYEPVGRIPEATEYPLRWLGIQIPSDAFDARKELSFGHRLFYRTQVEIPNSLNGRSVKLHFSGTSWIVGVFVNDRFVSGHTSVLVPWDIDVTKYVKFGKVNTITLSVKSGWYAIDLTARKVNRKSLNDVRNLPSGVLQNTMFVDAIYPSSKGEGNGSQTGIVYPVKLVVVGPAYTSDVFIRTSVTNKRLDADVEVTNSTSKDMKVQVKCEAVYEKSGQVEKTFGPADLKIPADKTAIITLGDEWTNPKLWWPEDNADVYVMRTTLIADGKPIDVRNDTFGFREVSIDGKHFLLNGLRRHFWNWVDVEGAEDPNDWLTKFKADDNRFHRISDDHSRLFGCQEQALEWLDRHGIAGRKSTCIDGMFITNHLPNPLVWQNFERHVRQVVKAYRNHPSIMMWSLANEMMLITGRLYYGDQYQQDEKRMAELFKVAKELDPTRASYDDGAGDLGGLGPINCQHYTWPEGENFPKGAYEYPVGPAVYPRPVRDFAQVYKWDANRPLVLGEVAFLTAVPSQISWFGGPDVYMDRDNIRQAEADYLRISIEGARWQDATAICPWTIRPAANKSFASRAVFVREQNSCFFAGSTFTRTIKVFNDTRLSDPITLRWQLRFGNTTIANGAKAYRLQPGHNAQDALTATLPNVTRRTEAQLLLTLYVEGKPVFDDVKLITILPQPSQIKGLDDNSLFVYDPNLAATRWLDARLMAYTLLNDLNSPPGGAGVLVIGRNALTDDNRQQAAITIRDWVSADNTVVVLEQQHPLEGDDLPIPGIVATPGKRKGDPGWMEFKEAGGQSGSICFAAVGQHPIFNELAQRDFFTWAGKDDRNFRNSYATPATGALPLVLAGNEMTLAPMLELSPGRGRYLLSQILIEEKIGVEPAADTLLYNILSWAATQKPSAAAGTVAYLADDASLGEFLASTGLDYTGVDKLEKSLLAGNDILIVRAKPDAVRWLTDHNDSVRQFCERGGWIMLAGLDKDGIAPFNRLVGFEHRIRPFGTEASQLLTRTDPLLLGIGPRDVTMFSDEMIAPWMGLKKVSDVIYTNVIDGTNIASFADGISPKLANGLTNHEFWQYIQYISNPDDARIDFKFDRPETFTKINLWVNGSYYFVKDLQLVFDGNEANVIAWTLPKSDQMQTLDLGSRTCSQISILVKGHYPGKSTQHLGGIDEVELYRKLPDDFDKRIVILAKPAGLVKYPLGKAGILLNQIDYTRKDTDENITKKRKIFFNLLRNMGASFKSQ